MAGQGQELILEMAVLARQGNVADDDDSVRRAAIVERLPVGLEPAQGPIRGRQRELQAERLAPCRPRLRRVRGRQGQPLGVPICIRLRNEEGSHFGIIRV